jgi:hypothetical protein
MNPAAPYRVNRKEDNETLSEIINKTVDEGKTADLLEALAEKFTSEQKRLVEIAQKGHKNMVHVPVENQQDELLKVIELFDRAHKYLVLLRALKEVQHIETLDLKQVALYRERR